MNDPHMMLKYKRGSQTDRLYRLMDDAGFSWTYGELEHKLGWSKNSIHSALHRLKLLGLIERDGVVEIDNRLHCRWKIRRD